VYLSEQIQCHNDIKKDRKKNTKKIPDVFQATWIRPPVTWAAAAAALAAAAAAAGAAAAALAGAALAAAAAAAACVPDPRRAGQECSCLFSCQPLRHVLGEL